jgi:hypothetical protein
VARGDVIVVRHADDLVVAFESWAEAQQFLEEFRERLAKFSLELHADKTRLIEFGRFAAQLRKQRGEGKPETFTFLGVTHFCGRTTHSGAFTVWRITACAPGIPLRGLTSAMDIRPCGNYSICPGLSAQYAQTRVVWPIF